MMGSEEDPRPDYVIRKETPEHDIEIEGWLDGDTPVAIHWAIRAKGRPECGMTGYLDFAEALEFAEALADVIAKMALDIDNEENP